MRLDEELFDVAVVGGGNAGLSAALSAAERGARVRQPSVSASLLCTTPK
jgi:succinate dehydrogenase/fumarate reductase flavoprotein subunit